MARIRSVHPGLWTDEAFVEMSMASRLFYIGLWNEADDYGLFEWKPMRLKMRLAPADNIDASAIMDEIEAAGFIMRLEREGRGLGLVRNFRKFQRPKTPSSPITPVDDHIISVIGLRKDEEIPKSHRSTGEALPQPYPSPSEIPLQMEDGGDKKEGKNTEPSVLNPDTGVERASKPRAPSTGSRIPDDWAVTDEGRAFAASKGLTPDRIAHEVQKFRDYWQSTAGAKGRKASWDATWRVWCSKASEDRRQQSQPPKMANGVNLNERWTTSLGIKMMRDPLTGEPIQDMGLG